MLFAILMAVLLVGSAAGQQASGAAKAPSKKVVPAAVPKPEGLTVDGVIAMGQAGLSEDVIIARLRKEDKVGDLSTNDMIRLKKANMSDAVIKVMLDPKAEIKPPAPAAPPIPAPTPVPLVVQTQLVPGVINPSGATPALGSAASGDPNDPMVPHDSGIYLFGKDANGAPKLIVLERAAYQGAKTGTAGLMLTGGLKKAKTKAVIAGPRASIRAEASPVFYFYFDDKAAGLGKSYFGIANVSNPNQFALIRLEVAKSNRETVIMEANIFGASSGTYDKSMVGIKSERIRAGLYRVTLNNPLLPGEYCFLASAGALGAYAAGAAGAADIFDFRSESKSMSPFGSTTWLM